MKFRVRLVEGETELQTISVTGEMPPAGTLVAHGDRQWFASAPAWVLEGKELFPVISLTLHTEKKVPKRRGPTRSQFLD